MCDYYVDDPHEPWTFYESAEGNICMTNNFVLPSINIPMASWERAKAACEIMNRGVVKHRFDLKHETCSICGEVASDWSEAD